MKAYQPESDAVEEQKNGEGAKLETQELTY
jgi:hypothetical protein